MSVLKFTERAAKELRKAGRSMRRQAEPDPRQISLLTGALSRIAELLEVLDEPEAEELDFD